MDARKISIDLFISDPDQYEKLLLQMCNRTGMLIANGVFLWTAYMLFFEGILDCIHKFSLKIMDSKMGF